MNGAYEVGLLDGFVLSIAVLFAGMMLTRRVRILSEYNIPPAVSGGLLCSVIVAAISVGFGLDITFDLSIRDFLLLVFFSCIGLGAKLDHLRAGGRALLMLVGISAVFLIVQDAVGVGLAVLLGAHPALGVMGGSVSLAGGHGTAIAWGQVVEAQGLEGAESFGIALATIGLIAGGLLGGPIAGRLIKENDLSPVPASGSQTVETKADPWTATVGLPDELASLMALAVCVEVGSLVNRLLFDGGVVLPGFLTAMMAGIVLTNVGDVVGLRLNQASVDRAGEISLNVFLAMSLMAMELVTLAQEAGLILVVIVVQMLVMTVFVVRVVFRVMGRDYDAAVISAGFAGLGLGATPVAIANMGAITGRYGPSPKAFLVVPLIGAFFIDILNAGVINAFLDFFGR